MNEMASQITSLTIVYSTVYSGADHRKHQSSASLAFVWGIHRESVKFPHKGPVTRKMLPCDDVVMISRKVYVSHVHICYNWNDINCFFSWINSQLVNYLWNFINRYTKHTSANKMIVDIDICKVHNIQFPIQCIRTCFVPCMCQDSKDFVLKHDQPLASRLIRSSPSMIMET